MAKPKLIELPLAEAEATAPAKSWTLGDWRTTALGILAAVIVATVAWTKYQSVSSLQKPSAPQKFSIRSAEVKVQAMPEVLEAVGKVVPSASVGVRPQVGGILKKVLIKDGEMVTAGQPLFEIDDAGLKVSLAQAEAQYQRDKALADNAVSVEDRMKPLAALKYTTAKDFEAARSARISTLATAEATRLQIDQVKIALAQITIPSPMSGRTGEVLVKPGDLLSLTATTPMIVVNAISPVDLAFAVPQQKIAAVRAAMTAGSVKVEAKSSRTDQVRALGEIVFIDNAIGDTSGTINVKARFANTDGALLPGEFFAVRVIVKTYPKAVTIPEQALQQGQAGPYVYVVNDGKAKVEALQIAYILDGQAVVAKGLSGGETVVTNVPSNLRDGSAVELAAQPANETAPALRP